MPFDKKQIEAHIREVKNFPKDGVAFKDITPLLANAALFELCIEEMAWQIDMVARAKVDYIVGIKARGFIIGAALAQKMKTGFVPIRKKGKLPYDTISIEYSLEYGHAAIEIHKDALKTNDSVVIVDDLLASGGTTIAACNLIENLGASIAALAYLVELEGLGARKVIKSKIPIISLIKY